MRKTLFVVAVMLSLTGVVCSGRSPSTCQEFVEQLQVQGMDIIWSEYRSKSIVIGRSDIRIPNASGPLAIATEMVPITQTKMTLGGYIRGSGIMPKGVVFVVQCKDAADAREEAGSIQDAVAWGRFLIYGDRKLLKEIQKHL